MKKIYFLILISVLFGNFHSAHGAITENYKLLEPLPCISGGGIDCAPGESKKEIAFNEYVSYAYRFLIALAVFLTVVMIIVGGFQYMFSESFTSKSDAKDRMKNAALGLAGVLVSYLILETIDPRLVQTGINIPEITPETLNLHQIDTFRNDLDSAMEYLSAQSLRDLGQKSSEKKTKQDRIDELDMLMKESTDPIEYNEYEIEKERLKSEIVNIDSGINRSLFRAVQSESFRQSVQLIDDLSNNYSKFGTSFDKQGEVDSLIKKVEDTYSKYSGKMNVTDRQEMNKEKDFYINQLKEEQGIMSSVASYKNLPSIISIGSNSKGELKKTLEGFVKTYTSEMEKRPNFGSEQINSDYQKIIANRIIYLKKVLNN